MTEQEWLAKRKKGITGSDIAAICGLNHWKSPLAIWAEKTGRSAGPEETLQMRRGQHNERWIAQEWADQTGTTLIKPDPRLIENPECHWQLGSPDFYIDGTDQGLEIKDVGHRSAWRWGPSREGYADQGAYLQAAWYLGISKRPGWWIVACIAGEEIREYYLEPDSELFGMLTEVAIQFRLDYLATDRPPPADGYPSSVQAIRAMFPEQENEEMLSGQGLAEIAQQWLNADKAIKAATIEKEEAANQLKMRIQAAAGIRGEGWQATWKQTRACMVTDWEAIAKACNPSQSVIDQHSTQRVGHRRFLLREIKR